MTPRNKRPDLTTKRSRLLRRRRVGLLGGSFNPAHEGHLHLSEQAIRALGLTELWWLVAPSNPFKGAASLAPFKERLASAMDMVQNHPRIRVSDIEAKIGAYRTVQTLRYLKRTHPDIEFVWIAGMDLIHHLHKWQNAPDILASLPIAFFERPPLHQGTRRALITQNPKISVRGNAQTGQKTLKKSQILLFRRRHTVNMSATALRNGAAQARTKPE